ncbi:phosphatidylserine synthase [Aureobasidium namibiae CBS 147.97]|uniref:CDP-diacylglycerol--serine O-phosphatidyltransferase n=1 Tax=Aureobasidium namibiae CBS 147.97 TaxID=1043004 RepID=A0A074W9G8_9PEZI|nr:phosphatidylserine synthase [Aureobasidium namibiae CBS 147.97]KEQ69548.1 phosphatidylserine synthase [Aureobasidium namibiae CBS 147.97]
MSRRVNASVDAAKEVTASPHADRETAMDKQKRLLEESDPGHFSMIRAMHLADLITLLNGFCGINSVLSSLRYCMGNPNDLGNLWAALAFMPFGLFFDFMDGKVARWRKKSSLMGQELDSLADLISFCVSPAVASVAIGMRTPFDHFLLTSFALCGLLRLARFNITTDSVPKDANGKAKYFEGLPTPTSLGIVALISYWVSQGWIHNQIPLGVVAQGSIFEFHPAALIFVAHGCLMISKTFHVPKP